MFPGRSTGFPPGPTETYAMLQATPSPATEQCMRSFVQSPEVGWAVRRERYVFILQGSLDCPVWGDQTRQMHDESEEFP